MRDGRIELKAITLEPGLSEASLLAASGDTARPLVHNGSHRSYLLPKASLNGREFRPSTYFTDGQITFVNLTWADPQVEGGSPWDSYSFERERSIAKDDVKWLAATLKGSGSVTDTYTFDWGTIWAGFSVRDGFSSVVISYNRR